jgi:hypothetical protein
MNPAAKSAPSVPSAASAPVAGSIYTCPMHPQIRRNQPGQMLPQTRNCSANAI